MNNALWVALNPYESPVGDDEPNGRGAISADQYDWAPREHITRVLATLLAISGLFFVPIFLEAPLWPGNFIWLGWVLIACGVPFLNRVWFWTLCLLWDGFWFLFVWGNFSWESPKPDTAYVAVHVVAVVGASIASLVMLSWRPK